MKTNKIKIALIVASIVILNVVSVSTQAQDKSNTGLKKSYFYLQPNIGISQYFGDLNKKDYWNQHPKFAFGAVLGYQLSPVFGLRGQFVKADLYSVRSDQNKKLSSKLWDGALHLTININEIFEKYNDKRFINFYLFTGAGISSYKSKLEDIATSVITNEHSQKQNSFFLPVGAGAALRLSNTFSVNLEYGDRTIFGGKKLDFIDAGKENNDHYSYASAGLQINFGLKDSDDDGVRDKDDLCPETPGKIKLAGCPDKDNDGIADKDDVCPDVAGEKEFKGCPDTDGDGIVDSEDACPTAAGKKELNGCPDKDGDGIADKDDKCPDIAGTKELAGCADRDGDGVADNDDACPDIKGLIIFAGCIDTDGDSIPDNKDNCPEVAGVAANNGCPEVIKETVTVLQKIIYFGSDKSVALERSVIDLNEIAASIMENPDALISVSGYADERESAQYNLRLSEKRSDFVINYLKKKGITSSKIEKLFFGKSNPAADNNTAAGRALNRRVEIKITK
jgi:OmpA-OmpF porin, OOP family